LSALVDSIPSYPVIRGNISGVVALNQEFKEKLIASLQPASVDTVDGLKLNFSDGWLLIRPSGTEPKIRLTAEAKTESVARNYYDHGIKILKEFI